MFQVCELPRYEICTRMRPYCHVTVMAICISCNTQIRICAPFNDRLSAHLVHTSIKYKVERDERYLPYIELGRWLCSHFQLETPLNFHKPVTQKPYNLEK